jgi:hypothetical protein
MTCLVFTPDRATTTPPTASDVPLTSDETRNASPTCTLATCSTNTGTPFDEPTAIVRRSSTDSISPTPRTISHAPFDSSTLPPTLTLLAATAPTTALNGRLNARSRFGSTSIWYCCTAPPTDATSATPGTAFSW